MNYTYYYFFPVALVIFFVIYQIVVMPKLKKRSSEGMEFIRQSLKGKEEEKKNFYLSDDQPLKPIVHLLKDEMIQAIVNCREKQDFKKVAKRQAINALGEFSKELIGFEFKKEDNQDTYFLVITKQALHYFVFKEGQLKEKISYSLSEIKKVKLGKGGITDSIRGGQKHYEKLSFEHAGEAVTFFYFPMLTLWPNGLAVNNMELSVLFAEPFELELKQALGMSG